MKRLIVFFLLTIYLTWQPAFNSLSQQTSDSVSDKKRDAVLLNEEKKTEQLVEELSKKQAEIVKGLDKLEEKGIKPSGKKPIKPKIKYINRTIHDTVFVIIPCPEQQIQPVKIVVIGIKDSTPKRRNFLQRIFKTKRK